MLKVLWSAAWSRHMLQIPAHLQSFVGYISLSNRAAYRATEVVVKVSVPATCSDKTSINKHAHFP